MKLIAGAWLGLLNLQVVMALLIFVPAGTVRFWQGWMYWTLCLACFGGITLDLMGHDRDLLARRMKAGARAETRPAQKIIQGVSGVAFLALLVVSGLDHRFDWSNLPFIVMMIGDGAVLIGCFVIYRVFRANRYTAATVQVEDGQTLTDTGPYAIVRHPMYSGALLYLFGTPLALGSTWSLLASLVLLGAIIVRLLDEERLLAKELRGYTDYQRRVPSRLIPAIW